MQNKVIKVSPTLIDEIKQLIETAKNKAISYVNSSMILLYWSIGRRINAEILNEERAEYGEQIVKQIATQLALHYGKGFSGRSLFKMIQFAKTYGKEEVTSMLSILSWSHFLELITFEDPLKRKFYTEMCRIERWSVRQLRKKIGGMLYERTAIAKMPEKIIEKELQSLQEHNEFTQNLTFRDPYILNFLELPDAFSESDLENAILDELCFFLQELGTDFSFIARQKRITVDDEDYYLDLLTYHRGLRRLIAIELKLDKFTAGHKGQMELYLRWLDKYERKEGEEAPLGLILCAKKSQGHIELLELNKAGIHVAQYLTQLPPREIFEAKLNKAIETAKEKHAKLQTIEQEIDAIENKNPKKTKETINQ